MIERVWADLIERVWADLIDRVWADLIERVWADLVLRGRTMGGALMRGEGRGVGPDGRRGGGLDGRREERKGEGGAPTGEERREVPRWEGRALACA